MRKNGYSHGILIYLNRYVLGYGKINYSELNFGIMYIELSLQR
jgi:hypothetical protein